jgi:hypothetical protein
VLRANFNSSPTFAGFDMETRKDAGWRAGSTRLAALCHVCVFWVAPDVGGYEGTFGYDLQITGARVIERICDKLAADPTAFERWVNLCMWKDEAVVPPFVLAEPRKLAIYADLVTTPVAVI